MGQDRPEIVTTHGDMMMASWPRMSPERCPDHYAGRSYLTCVPC
jgi:hypothetical protein